MSLTLGQWDLSYICLKPDLWILLWFKDMDMSVDTNIGCQTQQLSNIQIWGHTYICKFLLNICIFDYELYVVGYCSYTKEPNFYNMIQSSRLLWEVLMHIFELISGLQFTSVGQMDTHFVFPCIGHGNFWVG